MIRRGPTSERLAFFSDAVFAVIITIMVLELKPPEHPTLDALLPLWPTFLSYAVSYLFIAIVWVNHHHLMRFIEYASPRLVSLYASVFVLVNAAYLPFERLALAEAKRAGMSASTRRFAKVRSSITLGAFAIAALVSLWLPAWGFALITCTLFLYLSPVPVM